MEPMTDFVLRSMTDVVPFDVFWAYSRLPSALTARFPAAFPAMVSIAERAMGITPEELAKEAVRVFGGTRVTPGLRERLDQALGVVVRDGRVQVIGGVVVSRGPGVNGVAK